MTEQTARCVLCTGEKAATHGYTCEGHFQRLGAVLRDIEDEAALLSAVPSMRVRTGSGHGTLASERSPARLNVLVLTDRRRGRYGYSETPDDTLAAGNIQSVLDVLHTWAAIVRAERALEIPFRIVRYAPAPLGPYHDTCQHDTCMHMRVIVPIPPTVSGERDLLTRHLEHVADQPWVRDLYTQLRHTLGHLKACNGTQPDKPAGRCYIPTDDGNCDGPIWIDPIHGNATCGRCTSTWTGPQLALLFYELEEQRREANRPRTEDGRPMLTAHELVDRGLVSSVSNVRVIAHRRRIVSVDGHYDPDAFAKAGV